ncbi:VC0807 family protein [Nonomuraea endophytica]|uniref:DUF3159 domain-containing protein n=1 Tax=Nonomuraea endophytica TaxID=714136 RepID=A0A7W8EGA1_9ACTN|nr:VC0807 family protein [Nonomuraea endophytica]MBB5079630.1 hypothetical protein [Nonomuraea endophytica]
MNHPPITLPRLTTLARDAVPKLLEAVVAPLVIVYASVWLLGTQGALFAGLAWLFGGLIWRLARRAKVPATMWMAALALSFRTAVSFWTGDWHYWAIQPELGTICISVVFLASVRLNKPLVQKLTLDFVPLPSVVLKHARMRRFFARITLLWGFVLLANSTVSIWLALNESQLQGYMLVRTGVVALISGSAIAFSVLAFKRVLRRMHVAHA